MGDRSLAHQTTDARRAAGASGRDGGRRRRARRVGGLRGAASPPVPHPVRSDTPPSRATAQAAPPESPATQLMETVAHMRPIERAGDSIVWDVEPLKCRQFPLLVSGLHPTAERTGDAVQGRLPRVGADRRQPRQSVEVLHFGGEPGRVALSGTTRRTPQDPGSNISAW